MNEVEAMKQRIDALEAELKNKADHVKAPATPAAGHPAAAPAAAPHPQQAAAAPIPQLPEAPQDKHPPFSVPDST